MPLVRKICSLSGTWSLVDASSNVKGAKVIRVCPSRALSRGCCVVAFYRMDKHQTSTKPAVGDTAWCRLAYVATFVLAFGIIAHHFVTHTVADGCVGCIGATDVGIVGTCAQWGIERGGNGSTRGYVSDGTRDRQRKTNTTVLAKKAMVLIEIIVNCMLKFGR